MTQESASRNSGALMIVSRADSFWRASLRLLGLSSFFVFIFSCFREGRDLWTCSVPVPLLVSGTLAGIVWSSFALFLVHRLALSSKLRTIILSILTASGTSLLCFSLSTNVQSFFLPSLALLFTPFTFFLQAEFERKKPFGLRLGIALAFAFCLCQLPTLIAHLFSVPFAQILFSVSGLVVLLSLPLLHSADKTSTNDAQEGEKVPGKMVRVNFCYLTLTTFFFFFFNALWDWLFYRMHSSAFPLPHVVFLYIWVFFPLVGFYFDRKGASLRLLLFCFFVIILAPILSISSEGTVFFWFIYFISISVRSISFLYLLIVFGLFYLKYKNMLKYHGFIFSMPIILLVLSFFIARYFVTIYPGIVPFFCVCLVISSCFSFISQRIQYIFTISGILSVSIVEGKNKKEIDDVVSNIAKFANKYGISQREQDVLSHIIEGNSTAEIADKLFITENTVKTHVGKILLKTGCRNRVTLTSRFYKESHEE